MAVYRQIHVSYWQDNFVLELTPEEKYFYLYLMTNSKTTQCGCYELPYKIIELETGYNRETVEKLLNRFIDYGKIQYCQSSKEVLLMNWYKYNFSRSPSVMACIKKEIAEIKHQPFVQYCVDTLGAQCTQSGGNNNNNNNKNNNNKKNKKPVDKEENKPKKIAYADFVTMTKEEYQKLIEQFNERGTKDRIERLSLYKGSTGKKYASDYLTILSWERKNKDKSTHSSGLLPCEKDLERR